MTCYCLPDSLFRELVDATDDAERIANALEGIARYADSTQHGEIGDNLAILSEALKRVSAKLEAVAAASRRNPVIGVIGGGDA